MAKKPTNHGKEWTKADVNKLEHLAEHNTPTGLIAYKLKRTESAIYNIASQEDISLKPVNQKPYNRRK